MDIEGGVIEVAARRPGVISEVLAQEGDVVTKGQVLARLEDRDAVLAINSAKAAVAQARSELNLERRHAPHRQARASALAEAAQLQLVSEQQLDRRPTTS